ncbi:MAG: hypothetical protein KDA25_00665 [Phycisphaerales bacterium]|nr:hypothetical protein [Phycisphaerales bacterium]
MTPAMLVVAGLLMIALVAVAWPFLSRAPAPHDEREALLGPAMARGSSGLVILIIVAAGVLVVTMASL